MCVVVIFFNKFCPNQKKQEISPWNPTTTLLLKAFSNRKSSTVSITKVLVCMFAGGWLHEQDKREVQLPTNMRFKHRTTEININMSNVLSPSSLARAGWPNSEREGERGRERFHTCSQLLAMFSITPSNSGSFWSYYVVFRPCPYLLRNPRGKYSSLRDSTATSLSFLRQAGWWPESASSKVPKSWERCDAQGLISCAMDKAQKAWEFIRPYQTRMIWCADLLRKRIGEYGRPTVN